MIIDIDVIGQSSFNDAVCNRTGVCTVCGVDVHPVLPSESERTYGTLGCIVVHGYMTIFQEYTKIFFLIKTILQSLGCLATDVSCVDMLFCPRKEVIDLGLNVNVSPAFSFCSG